MMLFEGVRVIEWASQQVGPLGACLLGDLGAEVIKIEEPGRGDPNRGVEKWLGVPLQLPGGRHALFETFNRNKKSVSLNLKKEEGRQIVYRLVEKSDVFLTNFRRAVANRLALDYDTLRRYNPKLIYASSNVFGPKGPDSWKPGNELTGYARSGMMNSCSTEDEGMPHYVVPGSGDAIASIMLMAGVSGALYGREKLGIGQEVTVSQMGSIITLMRMMVGMAFFLGKRNADMRRGRHNPENSLTNWYRCKDGKWIVLGQIYRGEEAWTEFCQVIARVELEKDPRFCNLAMRLEHRSELTGILEDVFATRTVEEWERAFSKADLVFSPVRDFIDLASDPQAIENQYVVDFDHPVLGKVKLPGIVPDFSETPGAIRLPAPEVGQHTEEVLIDILGYTWEDIGRLREQEII